MSDLCQSARQGFGASFPFESEHRSQSLLGASEVAVQNASGPQIDVCADFPDGPTLVFGRAAEQSQRVLGGRCGRGRFTEGDVRGARTQRLDADAEVHRVLTEKVFPRQADVLTVADWRPSTAAPATPATPG